MAAEIASPGVGDIRWRGASMRPRRMAAEIESACGMRYSLPAASMRPRRMAAEIAARRAVGAVRVGRFNEAAANGRGNLVPDLPHLFAGLLQ